MPSRINGFGTWYYGRANRFVRRDVCEHCQQVGDLESYDTVEYLSLFFVPTIPLGKKRIIDECPHCKRLRVCAFKEWAREKDRLIGEAWARIRANPLDVREAEQALFTAVSFQDEKTFAAMAAAVWGALPRPEILIAAAKGFSYFGRLKEAEAACRAALAQADDPSSREELAVILLRQARPNEARPFLEHIVARKLRDKTWLLHLLTQGYQAAGMHREALAVLAGAVQAFPDLESDAVHQRLRRTSERYYDRKTPVPAPLLGAPRQVREGKWSMIWPRLAGPVLLLLLALGYFGAAYLAGASRDVFLVNGLNRPYTAEVNGRRYDLEPLSQQRITVAEGEIAVRVLADGLTIHPQSCRVETPFLLRPFLKPTYVINPDRVAILYWEETIYSSNPDSVEAVDLPSGIATGELLHVFQGIDYCFKPFPERIKTENTSERRRRLEHKTDLTPSDAVALLTIEFDTAVASTYIQRQLEYCPENHEYLDSLIEVVPPREAVAILRPRLMQRPVDIDWHRAYQIMVGKAEPDHDLEAEYEQYLQDDPDNPALIYLMGSASWDEVQAESYYQRAAAKPEPCAHALAALAAMRLSAGRYGDSLALVRRALSLAPDQPDFTAIEEEALSGLGRVDELLARLEANGGQSDPKTMEDKVRYLIRLGETEKAQNAVDDFCRGLAQDVPPELLGYIRAHLELYIAYCSGAKDRFSNYESLLAESDYWRFITAVTGNDLETAGAVLEQSEGKDALWYLTMYITAAAAGRDDLADRWLAEAVGILRTGWRGERKAAVYLAADRPPSPDKACRLVLEPGFKAVYLAAMGLRFPGDRRLYFDLARKLDHDLDFPHLTLAGILGR